jgi:tetratricopeptide (TPR) repeat protein
VEVTGAEGRRTKYQKKATAQMLVKAKPTKDVQEANDSVNKENIGKQEVKLEEDTILLDRVKYVDDGDNVHFQLNILQQTVLLALCLDVKNDNPMDGLTAEQMGAYLERVLQQHDDWMVYATGLLERAWLESERNHTRERALLQLQALADQHTNRLTFTQSTFQAAVEDSAPPQERLRNIHYIVYPPRWGALRDLAERYAKIGIVTSAAEIFEEIELWDEVVECYRRAGKEKKAEEVVRKRLKESETPRMWSALGDITGDTSCYEKALELSNGKFSSAYVALGKYYAEKGDLSKAVEQYKMAVHIKPLSPHVWFRLGTLSMRLEDWETALQAFTEVVQQEPEEGDAWANVAAIHMHNKNPQEAYPALNEVSEVLHFISLLLTILTLIFPSP